MAIIGKIRSWSYLLIIIIGFALLAFVMGDLFGNGGLLGNGAGPTSVGEIGDVEVSLVDLERRTEYWKGLDRYYQQNLSDDAFRRRAWDDIVYQQVIAKDIANNGFAFSEEEFIDIRFGDRVLDDMKNAAIYKGEDGQFDPELAKQYWSRWKTELPALWQAESDRIKKQRLTDKYNTLISKSIVANSLDAADSYKGTNVKVDLQYAYHPFKDIADSTVVVDDNDIRAFYNAHRGDKEYEQKAGRDLEMIVFDGVATEADIEAIRADLVDLTEDFVSTSNDSIFSVRNSSTKRYAKRSVVSSELDDARAADIFAAEDGTVVGPYRDGQQFNMIKVIGDDVDRELASARHILLNSAEENDEISSRADSILRAWKRGADFETLAEKYSEDPGFASNKGVYEDFPRGQMVPEFEAFAFNEAVGNMGVVKTDFGYHIMEVQKRETSPQKQIVEISKVIEPSTETMSALYSEARSFVNDNQTLEKFRASAEQREFNVTPLNNISPATQNVSGIADSRRAVRWAYKAEREVGQVSDPMEFGDQIIVLALSGMREDGEPEFDDVKEAMRGKVILEKKAEMITAELGQLTGLAEAAAAWDVSTKSAPGVSMSNPNLSGAGNEPLVIGWALGANAGDVLGPIEGNNGIYVVQVDSKTDADMEALDTSSEKDKMQKSMRATVSNRVIQAITKARNIKDNYSRYY